MEWIGEVPRHWRSCRFKDFLMLSTKASNNVNKIGLENIESKTGRFIETNTEFEGNGVEFKRNSIVYGKLRPYLQKVWLADFDGNAVGDFFVFNARGNSCPSYIRYLMLSDGFTKEADGSTLGAKMPRVSSDFIMTLHFCLPPIIEQHSIASYLDKKCSEIDKVVSAQQKRISLLQELKQSIITHAVTKGLNPNEEMKDSGVEWIGEVPKGWKVVPLKRFGKMNKGLSFTKADIVDEGEKAISYGQIHSKSNSGVRMQNELIRFIPNALTVNSHKSIASQGDFIFADTSEDYEGCGNCVYNDGVIPVFGGYHTIVLQTNSTNAKYLAYLFKTDCWRFQIRSRVYGVKVFSITQSILALCSILLPPLPEQSAIASYLDQKCSSIDTSISKAQHQIELLQEYKQSLITEVVTGKRKVC